MEYPELAAALTDYMDARATFYSKGAVFSRLAAAALGRVSNESGEIQFYNSAMHCYLGVGDFTRAAAMASLSGNVGLEGMLLDAATYDSKSPTEKAFAYENFFESLGEDYDSCSMMFLVMAIKEFCKAGLYDNAVRLATENTTPLYEMCISDLADGKNPDLHKLILRAI